MGLVEGRRQIDPEDAKREKSCNIRHYEGGVSTVRQRTRLGRAPAAVCCDRRLNFRGGRPERGGRPSGVRGAR